MTLHKELKKLKAYQSGERNVFTMYLNTNPADPEQLNGAWEIHLKNGIKELDKKLDDSNEEQEQKDFKVIKQKIIKELDDHKEELHKGIVLFAAEEPPLWSVHYVQVPVKNSFHWEKLPQLEQLEYMYKAYPEAGIIMPSFGEVRIIDTAMGMVKEDFSYSFDPNLEEWGEKKNMDPGGKHAIGSSKVDFLESRLKENVKRFFKSMGTTVQKLKKEKGWADIHVAGETELAIAFSEILPEKPASCVYKNLNNSKPADIIHQVFEK